MEQISISKFKATCLAVLERVHQTRVPILVTKELSPIFGDGQMGQAAANLA